jgi:hypothetical protein
MRKLLLSVVGALLFVAPAFAQYVPAPAGETAKPVIVTNPEGSPTYLLLIIALTAVNAILLAVVWSQLSGIRAALEKPKT